MEAHIIKQSKIVLYVEAIFSIEIFLASVMVEFYLKYVGLTFEQMSWFFSVILLLNCLITVPCGTLSDMMGRKRAFILGKIIYLLAMLSLFFVHRFEFVLATAVVFSFGAALSSGNLNAIVYENLNKIGEKGRFFQLASRATSLGLVSSALACLSSGYLGDFDLRLPLAIDCILLLSTLVVALLFLDDTIEESAKPTPQVAAKVFQEFGHILRTGVKLAVTNRTVFSVILFSAICFGVLRAGFNFYQPMLGSFNVSLPEFGWMMAGFNLCAAFCAYCFSFLPSMLTDGLKLGWLVIVLMLSSSILILFGGTALPLVFSAIVIHQMIRGLVDPYVRYAINKEIPAGHPSRTTVMSLCFMLRAIAASLAMVAGGKLLHGSAYADAFAIVSALGGIVILLCWLFLPSSQVSKSVQLSNG